MIASLPALTTRRRFLARVGGGALALALAGAKLRGAPSVPGASATDDLLAMSATRLAALIQARKVSSVEVVTAHYARIDAVNPRLNAVVAMCRTRALEEARTCDRLLAAGRSMGPLHGVPMTIKDSLDTEGVVSTGGTLGRTGFRPARDATVVARLRAAGAILLGKTNTPEFTLSGITQNLVYGRTFNPYNTTFKTGGSSGGAAAIIAAMGSPFDIGSDFGGSIRGPAHFCGITGIKPTSGRVPRTGHIVDYGGIFDAYQQLGPMARWVEDLKLILPIISGPDFVDAAIVPMPVEDGATIEPAKLRIAWYTENGGKTTPTAETRAAVEDAAKFFESLGCAVTADAPLDLLRECNDVRTALGTADGRAWVDRLVKRSGTVTTHPLLTRGGDAVDTAQFTRMVEQLDSCRSRMLGWISNYDLVLCPAATKPAEVYGPEADKPSPPDPGNISYTSVYNLTGWPGATVRAGTSPEGMPIGVQLIGRPWHEHTVLAAASALEGHTGGWKAPALT